MKLPPEFGTDLRLEEKLALYLGMGELSQAQELLQSSRERIQKCRPEFFTEDEGLVPFTPSELAAMNGNLSFNSGEHRNAVKLTYFNRVAEEGLPFQIPEDKKLLVFKLAKNRSFTCHILAGPAGLYLDSRACILALGELPQLYKDYSYSVMDHITKNSWAGWTGFRIFNSSSIRPFCLDSELFEEEGYNFQNISDPSLPCVYGRFLKNLKIGRLKLDAYAKQQLREVKDFDHSISHSEYTLRRLAPKINALHHCVAEYVFTHFDQMEFFKRALFEISARESR